MKIPSKIIIGMLGIMVFLSCQDMAKNSEEPLEETVVEERVYPVRTENIETVKIDHTIDYTGNLIPKKEVYFAPASPGRIDKIYVDVGTRVKVGQKLLDMDMTQLSQALTQLSSAQDAYDRIEKLNETGSIAEQQFEQAKTQLEMAKLNVELLKKNLNFTSPISGLVTAKYFENGELYSGAPNTQIGKAAVVVIQQLNPIKVVVNLSQSLYPEIKQGMEATFTCDIYPGQKFAGKVSRVYPNIDAMTRTFKTEFLISNPREILKPGMSVDMKLAVNESQGVLLPAISVLNESGTNNRYIFVNDNGTAKRIDVEVVNRHNDQLEVTADERLIGLELIVEGQGKLLNGAKIELVTK
jgi:membrane fusion protein (multidrug efflux system)